MISSLFCRCVKQDPERLGNLSTAIELENGKPGPSAFIKKRASVAKAQNLFVTLN